jgi:hypothetical protein
MKKEQEIDKRQENTIARTNNPETEPVPFLRWKHQFNEKTGKNEFDSLELSDKSQLDEKNLRAALKRASGTSDVEIGERILKTIARGMTAESLDTRLNDVSALLPALQPKDATEALLLGQYLTLHESAMKCLKIANLPDQGFYHIERLFILAAKLLNTANQTMHTFLKYRSGGQQTVQVVHVHNEGQAIVTQNLSSQTTSREGLQRNSEN